MNRNFYLLLTLVRSLDMVSYVLMSVLCIREYRVRRTRWGGGAYCFLIVTFGVLYLNRMIGEAVSIATGHSITFFEALGVACPVMVMLLLFHTFYNSEKEYLPGRRAWKVLLGLCYAAAPVCVIGVLGFYLGFFPRLPIPESAPVPEPWAFGAACAVLVPPSRRQSHRAPRAPLDTGAVHRLGLYRVAMANEPGDAAGSGAALGQRHLSADLSLPRHLLRGAAHLL